MKRILLLGFLIIFPFVSAQSDVFTSEDLVSGIKISSGVDLEPLGEGYKIRNIVIENTLYPREDWNQKVSDFDAKPEYFKNESMIRFEWQDPEDTRLEFEVSSLVETKNGFVKVREKISFPVLNFPDRFDKYLIPQENIDSDNSAIVEIASEIVRGEDDFYAAVFKIADWVENNIEYSLDTLTESISQKASWVLDNKYGVCDELTSLFVAMVRSIGIPARYISGVAYTNWNKINDFGPHAWAEVYFPDIGWVPFDITYGEFGFIDASHIKLKESLDSDEASVNYRWEGWMVDLKTEKLDIDTETKNIGEKLKPLIEINTSILKENVKFGSHNLVEVLLKNPNDFYIPTEVFISKSEGLQLDGKTRKQILLKPKEEKIVYWTLNVDKNLNEDYLYTFRILTHTTRNATSETQFNSSIRDPYFNLDNIKEILEQKSEEAEKTYSRKVILNCNPEKNEYYIYEKPKIHCNVTNNGNVYLRDLNVCIEKNCHKVNLGITQKKEITLMLNFSSSGKKDINVIVSNEDVSKSDAVKLDVLDLPKIELTDITYPENLSYGEKFTTYFTLNKLSESNPQDLVVKLEYNDFSKEWNISELTQNRRFIVNLDSRDLRAGENVFQLKVKYKDKTGRNYDTKEKINISLGNLSFLQKSSLFINNIVRIYGKIILKMLLIIAFVFAIVIGFIFRVAKKKH